MTAPVLVDLGPGSEAPGACLVWRLPGPALAISSAILGGGIGLVRWVINMTVDREYSRMDPVEHLAGAAASIGLLGNGVGLMTAVDVASWSSARFEGASVVATVGVRRPVFAADRSAPPHATTAHAVPTTPGTINLVAQLPVRLSPAALVNVVATMTEAKVQALFDQKVPGTGTASDAVCVLCPAAGFEQQFGGPRSDWGRRVAEATYASVAEGILRQRA